MKRTALITGITGQDSSYLAEFLLGKGYEVFGTKRRVSVDTTGRISHIIKDIHVIEADLLDQGSLDKAVMISRPDEVYNLAAQSFVRTAFDEPEVTGNITGLGVTRILDAIKKHRPTARFYQASTSEMFGNLPPPHNEKTGFYPRSPYAAAKLYGHWMTINYRESYGMFACCGILYNHESPRRGSEFVTQKICEAVAAIKLGQKSKLELGNLDAKRDWGHAKDYVKAMWLMLQQRDPDDYIVATGEAHEVREFASLAFARAGLNWQEYVVTNAQNFRPTEVDHLCGDSTKARTALGWKPEVSFQELINEMVDEAIKRLKT